MNVQPPAHRSAAVAAGRPGEAPRGLRRTYRFADGVRVMVWAYDQVVWVYPDGRRVKSQTLENAG